MKKPVIGLLILAIVTSISAQRTVDEFRYLTSLPVKDKNVFFDSQQNSMQMFFDKWNNLYLPNADSNMVSAFFSDFRPKLDYRMSDEEQIFDGQFMLLTWMGAAAYAPRNFATLFYFKDGEIVDVIHRIDLGAYWALDDFALTYDYALKRPRGWILVDRGTRNIRQLDPRETIDYIHQNGSRYGLSLLGDSILFHGWTWDEYGSNLVWKDDLHSMWNAIDKDRIAYNGIDAQTPDGRIVMEYSFVGYPLGNIS